MLDIKINDKGKRYLERWGWVLPWCYFGWQQPGLFSFLRGSALILFGYLLAVEDLKVQKISSRWLGIMVLCWGAMVSLQLGFSPEEGLAMGISGFFGGLLAGVVFYGVYFMSRKGLGVGDIRFMIASGLYLGYAYVFSAMFLGTCFAAFVGGALMLTKKLDGKTNMPFVPFLYLGILCTIL